MKTKIFSFALAALLAASCTKDEPLGNITLPESDLSVPQGRSDDDGKIVAFYNSYNTSILYDYTQRQMSWTFAAQGPLNPSSWQVVSPEPNSAGETMDLLSEVWLDFYTDAFLKEHLPARIFLTDSLRTSSGTFNYCRAQEAAMVVTLCSPESLAAITASQKLAYKQALAKAFWGNGGLSARTGLFPEEYFELTDYVTETNATMGSPDHFKARGLWYRLRASNGTLAPAYDLRYFFDTIMTMQWSAIETELNTYPLLKQKFDVMQAWLLAEHGFDLTAMLKKTY